MNVSISLEKRMSYGNGCCTFVVAWVIPMLWGIITLSGFFVGLCNLQRFWGELSCKETKGLILFGKFEQDAVKKFKACTFAA